MKLAIIPPNCYPYKFGNDNYKLILPQHRSDQHHFEATMLNHRRGGFTILDNGVAEGTPVEWSALVKMAIQYHVNEIVLPDVMGDAAATRAAVEAMFDDAWSPVDHFGFMGVVQGNNSDEVYDLFRYYFSLKGRGLTSIGLPRCLIDTMDLDQARVLVAEWIRREDMYIDIHLLGTNPRYIWELRDFGRSFRALNVRGVDTSAPLVYTQAGEYIGNGRVEARRENYFDVPRSTFPKNLMEMNIVTMQAWVHG